MLFYSENPVLNSGLKNFQIQIRLRYGRANLINTHLRLKNPPNTQQEF
jgi:hypothetical protein